MELVSKVNEALPLVIAGDSSYPGFYRQLERQNGHGYIHESEGSVITDVWRSSVTSYNTALRKAAEILLAVNHQGSMAEDCLNLASEVSAALKEHAVKEHPVYGKIYAFEVDGFGNALLMDDANAPSLLSLPYLCDVPADDPVYLNTRAFVWSGSNPYFFKGKMAEGIGGPHIGYDMAWPMSLIIKALTSDVDDEIKSCVEMLMLTDAGTGFMHESFHVDDPNVYTRPWFAWQNTLFGELILDLIERGKLDLLNSIKL